MVPLGTEAIDFHLPDTITGLQKGLDDMKSDMTTIIMFLCNHCPYVKHIREELVRVANHYILQGALFIAISSNDVEQYPEDSPNLMKKEALEFNYPFPYMYDETQEVARAYDAACTPDFFLYDGNMHLAYRGQFDDSRPGNEKPITGKDLRQAIENVLNGMPAAERQVPSVGCNIKWKEQMP